MAKLVVTADGSTTIYLEELDEHYHSTFGAIQESKHIFIEAGFKSKAANTNKINLLEIGFGTGLNVLMTLQAMHNEDVNYWGIEPFPVAPELIKSLNYGEALSNKSLSQNFEQLHHAEWNADIELKSNFNLKKIRERIQDVELPADYFNLVYFDAFAPDVQPELWSELVFMKIFDSMKSDGILMTYSVKGIVKRALKSAGFKIEKLPGPIGKREILRAQKTIQP